MYRIRDFIFTEVVGMDGKNLGFVGDLLIDFNLKAVKGFNVISNSILKKDTSVYVENTLSLDPVIIASKLNGMQGLKFGDIKAVNVVDKRGNIMGRLEDIIFYEKSFNIRAFVMSRGFIYDILHGRKILSAKNLILGEKNILHMEIYK
ncbi:PRC-barrel domain-containing protein [Clostridium sp. LBM24168]